MASKGLEIIYCLSELWAELDTNLKEGVGTCRMSPLTPWKTHLPSQAVPLGEEPPCLLPLNLSGKSVHFVILGRIKMNFHSALFKSEVFYPVTTSIFAKLSLQPNRLCSIVTVCIFPGYLSKGRYGMHFFKAGNAWVEHTRSLNLEEHRCDARKCSLKICSMVVVIPYFLNINECSNIPVKFSFGVWILRFWKGMPYSVVAGLSKRTSASAYSQSLLPTWVL